MMIARRLLSNCCCILLLIPTLSWALNESGAPDAQTSLTHLRLRNQNPS